MNDVFKAEFTPHELTGNTTTQLQNASRCVIGRARERHDSIGCSETRTVGARRVLDTRIPIPNTSVHTGVHFSSRAVKQAK